MNQEGRVWWVSVLAGSAALGWTTHAADPKQVFKALLQSPPIIQEMIYQDKLPKIPNRPVPRDVGLAGSTNYATYRLIWQPNAILFHSLPASSDTNGLSPQRAYGKCFSAWDNEFWFLDGGKFAFLYDADERKAVPRAFPAPYHAAVFKRARAVEPINLGINHLKPGAVRWEQDQFSAVGTADQKPMFVTGEITALTNGIPCEIHVHYSNDMGVANYRLRYEYAQYQPPYYPTRITSYFKYPNREIEYRFFNILSVKTTDAPLPRSVFDPNRYIEARRMPLRIVTNDSLYTRLPSGSLIETPGAIPKLKLTRADYYRNRRNRYYYAAVILTTAAFAGLAAGGPLRWAGRDATNAPESDSKERNG